MAHKQEVSLADIMKKLEASNAENVKRFEEIKTSGAETMRRLEDVYKRQLIGYSLGNKLFSPTPSYFLHLVFIPFLSS